MKVDNSSAETMLKMLLSVQSKALSVEALMNITGWSKGYIYKLTSKGILPFYKPNNKTIFFNKDEIENWLLSNKQKTNFELQAEASDIVHLRKAAI